MLPAEGHDTSNRKGLRVQLQVIDLRWQADEACVARVTGLQHLPVALEVASVSDLQDALHPHLALLHKIKLLHCLK